MLRFHFRHLIAALAALSFAGACACDPGDIDTLSPNLEFIGDAITEDRTAKADYAIDFGLVTVGSQSTPEIFARNTGTARLTATVLEEEALPEIITLGFGGLDLPPNEQRQIDFSVTPREPGAFDAIVTLSTNEARGTTTIRLHGEGIRSELVCNPTEVNIGDVVRGESGSAQVTCTNHLEVPTTMILGGFVGAHRQHFRGTILAGGEPHSIEIPAGGSVDVEILFEAGSHLNGPISVSLPIQDISGRTLLSLRVDANVVEHALQIRYDAGDGETIPLVGCFRFPDTDIGLEETASLYVRNLSKEPVNLQSVALLTQDSGFRIASPPLEGEVTLEPGGADHEVTIAFTPESAARHESRLVVRSDDRLEPAGVDGGVRACVEGQGGGARISCTPSAIQFGPVAIGMSVTRTYTCTNSAQVRDGAIPQPLYVTSVESSDPKFAPSLRNPDGSPAPTNNGYLPGEEFYVDVEYSPDVEAFDTAEIIVHNESTANSLHATQVSGQGRDLPPCGFDISPEQLRFGVVSPNSQVTLAATIVNHFDTDCLVNAVKLSGDSDPAFTMEEIPSHTIEGHGSMSIPVSFAPTEYASSLTGSVEFFISDPSDPNQSIPLSGIAQTPCLTFEPSEMDFGSAPPLCAGRETFVSMVNDCAEPLSLDELTIVSGQGHFVFRSAPYLPVVLQSGDRREFSVYFVPDREGTFNGGVHVEVSDPDTGEDLGPYVFQMEGRGKHETMQTDTYVQKDQPKVDVLWVIDNSGSMTPLQDVIHDNIPEFMTFAIEQGIDFHVGVTTSGVLGTSGSACPGKTGFSENEDGRLVPHPNVGAPRILKSNMSRDLLHESFRDNIDVGTCHGTEAMYEAPRRALSDPWINTPEADGGNQGFLRRDASLSIIGVTDEPDHDSYWDNDRADDRSVERYVEFFQKLKPSSKKENVKVHFISGGYTGCNAHGARADACPRCIQGVELTGGVWVEPCMARDDPAWEDAFREMSQGAFGFDSAFGLRGQPADVNDDGIFDDFDLEVTVDGRWTPSFTTNGIRIWRYNQDNNSIAFTPQYVPGSDQTISVTYEVACMDY